LMKRKWSGWRWFWVAWLAMFAIGETAAIIELRRGGDDTTLSEFVWDFVVSNPLGWVGIAVLLIWLFIHFLIQKDSDDS